MTFYDAFKEFIEEKLYIEFIECIAGMLAVYFTVYLHCLYF